MKGFELTIFAEKRARMAIHMGEEISKRLYLSGLTKSELARRINRSRQSVHRLLKQATIPAPVLKAISEVLDFNFFDLLKNETDAKLKQVEEPQATFKENSNFPLQLVIRVKSEEQLLKITRLLREHNLIDLD